MFPDNIGGLWSIHELWFSSEEGHFAVFIIDKTCLCLFEKVIISKFIKIIRSKSDKRSAWCFNFIFISKYVVINFSLWGWNSIKFTCLNLSSSFFQKFNDLAVSISEVNCCYFNFWSLFGIFLKSFFNFFFQNFLKFSGLLRVLLFIILILSPHLWCYFHLNWKISNCNCIKIPLSKHQVT